MKTFDPSPLLIQYKNHPDFSNQKTILLTGGTTGIGYELSKQLLSLGFNIIITSSTKERADTAIKTIIKETLEQYKQVLTAGSNVASTTMIDQIDDKLLVGKIVGLGMDLSDLDCVVKACSELVSDILPNKFNTNKIDIIINNAGLVVAKEKTNAQHVSTTFSVCYLGHFLMNHLLKDYLNENARIIVISSNVAKMMFPKSLKSLEDIKWMEMIEKEQSYKSTTPTYAYNKLFCSMHGLNLHEKWVNDEKMKLSVTMLHPGTMMTNLPEKALDVERDSLLGWIKYGAYKMVHAFQGIPISKGAFNELRLAIDPKLQSCSGVYFSEETQDVEHPIAYIREEREKLWKLSLNLCLPFVQLFNNGISNNNNNGISGGNSGGGGEMPIGQLSSPSSASGNEEQNNQSTDSFQLEQLPNIHRSDEQKP